MAFILGAKCVRYTLPYCILQEHIQNLLPRTPLVSRIRGIVTQIFEFSARQSILEVPGVLEREFVEAYTRENTNLL